MDTFGRIFRVSVFGESHGPAIGVTIDGVRAGLDIAEEDFVDDIARRKSGALGTTARIEEDRPEIVSGVYRGHATGAPLTILFANGNARSEDYSLFARMPRPGHADYSANVKWKGFNDPRGGGHLSGRLTLPIVAAGVIAKKMIGGCSVRAEIEEIGGAPASLAKQTIAEAVSMHDSVGGVVRCEITGVPAGVGEPFFDSVESLISHAIFAIPGVRGIEFGDGFAAARMRGSEHNDPWKADTASEDSRLVPEKNGAGGINGGITNGAPIVFRVAFKPASSIGRPQKAYDCASGTTGTLEILGRHDACFVLRTPPIVEAMAAIVLADLMALHLQI